MAPCSPLPPPITQCDAPVYDFGTRLNTEEIPHTFVINNKGGSPLIISRIRNGCGCTHSELDLNTILPGESANLSTRVSIRGHIGPKNVSIYLHTNDPTNPVFQCHISGISTAEVEISPRDINVTLPLGPVPLETTVNIVNRTGIPMNPLTLSATDTFYQVQLLTNLPGVNYALRVKILTNNIIQTTQGRIRLATDHPRYPVIEIPVSVTVVRDINAYPPEMSLRAAVPGQSAESRYFIVKSSNGKPFKILKVASDPPVIPVGIQSTKPDWVRLRVGPLLPSPSMTGIVIRVHTDDPVQPNLDVPFNVLPQQ